MPGPRLIRYAAWCVCAGAALALLGAAEKPPSPSPRVVTLDPAAKEYVRVLGGVPETAGMRSGYVILQPSKTVGRHNTEGYEEAIIVLAGEGELRLAVGRALGLKPGVVAYCPPGTEHDVANTGRDPLRYVYVVARASR